MSSSNVEIARRATDTFNRRGIDAWLAQVDADIVWYGMADEPDPGPFRGREAIRALAARWMDLFSDLRFAAKEYIDVGDYVLVPLRVVGRMPDSDVWGPRNCSEPGCQCRQAALTSHPALDEARKPSPSPGAVAKA